MRKTGAQGGQPLAGAIADNGENGRFWGKTELLREEGEKRGGSSPECGEAAGEAAPWPSVKRGAPEMRRDGNNPAARGWPKIGFWVPGPARLRLGKHPAGWQVSGGFIPTALRWGRGDAEIMAVCAELCVGKPNSLGARAVPEESLPEIDNAGTAEAAASRDKALKLHTAL